MTQSLEREALELATILDTMADGVFVIDTEFIVQRWNRAMERITGYTPPEAIGRNCAFLNANTMDEHFRSLPPLTCDLFKVDWVDKVETVIKHCNGEEIHVIAAGRVLRDDHSEPVGAVITLTDITSLRRLETEMNQLRREVTGRFEFDNIVGKSPQMREIFNLVELAAASPVTVLITGETGTGKELVARTIHALSQRKNRTFIKVNCAALVPTLIESELFGHEKGAFTNAAARKIGRFEIAHKSTLFMDEIGELPLNTQSKLLQVLQDGVFERVGGVQPIKTDVRIIAATNQNLVRLVKDKLFRQDLFYRLNIFPIHIPPLRERPEDIPVLGSYFGNKYCIKLNRPRPHMEPEAINMLIGYGWPGNVRELQNFIERIIILKSGQTVTGYDIKTVLSGSLEQNGQAMTLAEVEKNHLEKVLQKTKGRVAGTSGAAELLDIKRSTLQYKLKKFNINPSIYKK